MVSRSLSAMRFWAHRALIWLDVIWWIGKRRGFKVALMRAVDRVVEKFPDWVVNPIMALVVIQRLVIRSW